MFLSGSRTAAKIFVSRKCCLPNWQASVQRNCLIRYESGKTKLRTEAAEKIAAALGVSTAWLVHGTLPVARGMQIDPPVPAGGLILKFLELPPALAFAVKRLAMQNGSTVEMELLDLVHQGLEAMHQKALACAASAGKPALPASDENSTAP